jgi:hypothetical protein
MDKPALLLALLLVMASAALETAAGESQPELRYKDDFLRRLVASVPDILKTQDPATGRFGEGIWIVNDQHPIYPLAVAWATKSEDNPYYHDPKVLEAIMDGGDALIEDMDENGQWVFRKKDGSTWGNIYQPWTYSRWIRAFSLIRDAMPPDRRRKWDDALSFGYGKIAETQLRRVHNIPSNHAMGLYIAGRVLQRPEWCEQAKAFIAKVAGEQHPGGFWSENYGPVVGYNFVYSDALGIYYSVSRDETVLPALERAAVFHASFTYPNGSRVETVDERNPYHGGITFPNVGFTFTPEGRGYIARQLDLLEHRGSKLSSDEMASYILYGEEGPIIPTAASDTDRKYVLPDGKGMVRRKGPWFICLSAYHCPIHGSRWIQDRQNLVSVYHDKCGLILGGGNTKLQPLWSTFTVGDVSLLKHKPGDENPDFLPAGELYHIPSAAGIGKAGPPSLGLVCGEEKCSVAVEPVDDSTLRIRLRTTCNSGMPVAAHLTLMPYIGQGFRTEKIAEKPLAEEGFTLSADQAGRWISHAGWKLSLPEGASVTWPVLPHNPYRKDGSSTAGEGRIVVSVPFSPGVGEQALTLSIEE